MYLGIDIGTSAVKAVLVAAEGPAIASRSAPLSLQSPQPLWSEQDPEAWWQATLAACEALRQVAPMQWQAIRAVGLSGQMHGAVLLDSSGTPLRPAILWNDGRAFAECAAMGRAMPDHGDIAGVPAMPGFTAPKLLWVARHEPDIHARIAHILLPKDYVRFRMTGVFATDMADAAGTLWLDEAKRKWSDALCAASATDPAWLPSLFEGTAISGEVSAQAAAALSLRPGTIVAAGGGDGGAGAVGIGAVNNGDAFLSLGTSGQFFLTDDAYRPNPESVVHAFAHAVPDRWFRMSVMLNGAAPLAWFASICDAPIEALLAEVAAARPDRSPLFLPYLTGERSPHNDPHIRGTFYGLEPQTSRGEMMRAVVEAVAFSFRDARDSLAAAGGSVESAMAIGGGTRSDLVLQTIADCLGIVLHRTAGADTGPAYGAARLAAVADGGMSLADLSQKPAIEARFEPNPAEADRYAARHARYRDLYEVLAPFAEAAEPAAGR